MEWISVKDRLPTAEEQRRLIIGLVLDEEDGSFSVPEFVSYCAPLKTWLMRDLLTEKEANGKVMYWLALPEIDPFNFR